MKPGSSSSMPPVARSLVDCQPDAAPSIALRHKSIRHSDVLLLARGEGVGGRSPIRRPADCGIRKVSPNTRIIH